MRYVNNIELIKLSIITPFFNSEKHLEECLQSICKQKSKYIEVIIINDCSNDGSLKIVNKFKKKYKYIKLIANKKNQGVSISRNKGIKHARGEYILFIDSDDKLIEGSLKKILLILSKNQKIDIFSVRSKLLNSNKIDSNQIYETSISTPPLNTIKNFNKFRATCWNFIVKKTFLNREKIIFKNIRVFEDQAFVANILCDAKSLKLIKYPIYERRVSEISTLGKQTGFIIVKSCIKLISEINRIYNKKKDKNNQFKIKFLISRVNFILEQLLDNILICNDNQIKKISNSLINNCKFIKKLDNKNNFIKFIKNVKNYKVVKIKKLKNKILNKKKVIIFCAGAYSEIIIKTCKKLSIMINFIIDNNPNYNNQKLSNIIIKNPHTINSTFFRENMFQVLVCNKKIDDFKKIKLQLTNMGVKKDYIIHINI